MIFGERFMACVGDKKETINGKMDRKLVVIYTMNGEKIAMTRIRKAGKNSQYHSVGILRNGNS